MPADQNTQAAQLKAEGNASFVKNDFHDAHQKYTLALALDENNAVLYANRAACSLSLKNFLDAETDATKATELDPSYAKAWARLASASVAMARTSSAVGYWQKALDALPKKNLNPSELRQKEQYAEGLKAAEERLRMGEPPVEHYVMKVDDAPWARAEKMYPELLAAQKDMYNSSAWVIRAAYSDWSDGLGIMETMHTVDTPRGPAIRVKTGGLVAFSNAILRDYRIFHLSSQDWMTKYNQIVTAECQKYSAWDRDGPDAVIILAKERLAQKGWNDVRPALSITVRAWIMCAFFEAHVRHSHGVAIEFLTRASKILDMGRRIWKDIPDSDRGTIFSDTFVRGVRCLHMDIFMQGFMSKPSMDSDYPLEDLLELADDILNELKNSRPDCSTEYDPGFISSFYLYPKANALSIKGLCHYQTARLDREAAPDSRIVRLLLGSEFYLKAAANVPEDDEKHPIFLHAALGCLWRADAPVGITLPIIDRIEKSIPKMKRIWEYSALAENGRDAMLQRTISYGESIRKKLEDGSVQMESAIRPEFA